MPGVVTLNFELEAMKNLNKWLEQQVISDILAVSELPNANSKGTLAAMLVLYKKTYGRRLCVVLEVNDRIDSAQLISLLTSIKYLGHDLDNGVIQFVCVISASRTALGAIADIIPLRIQGYSVPDFTQSEAEDFLHRNMNNTSAAVANATIQYVGTRAVLLQDLCTLCKHLHNDTDRLEAVRTYADKLLFGARIQFNQFLGVMERTRQYDEKRMQCFFRELDSGGSLTLDDALEAFGVTRNGQVLLDALARHHAFDVDPFKFTVKMQSQAMSLAIAEYVA
jgi:hypothetical protein